MTSPSRFARWSAAEAVERRLEIALLLLVISFPLKSIVGLDIVEVGGVPLLSLTKLAGVWFFGNFILYVIRVRPALHFGAVQVVLLALLALAIASTRQAGEPGSAIAATLRYANFIALFFALAILLEDSRLQILTVWALVASCAVSACVALANFRPGGSLVATTPYGNPNDVAFMLATALPFAFWLWNHARRWRALTLPMIAAISAATILSWSRGALVGLAAALAWQRYRERLSTRSLVAVCAVPLLAAATIIWMDPARARESLAAKQKVAWENVTNRLEAWGAAAQLTFEHPLLGVGPGNFQFHYASHWERPGAHRLTVVHNTYLEIAAELGIFALLLFLGYLAFTFSHLAAAARDQVGPPGLAAAARLALIVAMVAGVFLSEQFFAPFWLIGALGSALWTTRSSPRRAPE